jgi:hypothetical protein
MTGAGGVRGFRRRLSAYCGSWHRPTLAFSLADEKQGFDADFRKIKRTGAIPWNQSC